MRQHSVGAPACVLSGPVHASAVMSQQILMLLSTVGVSGNRALGNCLSLLGTLAAAPFLAIDEQEIVLRDVHAITVFHDRRPELSVHSSCTLQHYTRTLSTR